MDCAFFDRIYDGLVAIAPSLVKPASQDGNAPGLESLDGLKFLKFILTL